MIDLCVYCNYLYFIVNILPIHFTLRHFIHSDTNNTALDVRHIYIHCYDVVLYKQMPGKERTLYEYTSSIIYKYFFFFFLIK